MSCNTLWKTFWPSTEIGPKSWASSPQPCCRVGMVEILLNLSKTLSMAQGTMLTVLDLSLRGMLALLKLQVRGSALIPPEPSSSSSRGLGRLLRCPSALVLCSPGQFAGFRG
jgi:hypothetical protein